MTGPNAAPTEKIVGVIIIIVILAAILILPPCCEIGEITAV